jgi:molybdenum cofactor cytidylyltransferase
MEIDCLLLAGGSSARMGKPKLLLDLGGRTLFEHVLGVHRASSARRICAVVPGWIEGFGEIAAARASRRVSFAVLAGECEMSESLKTGWRRLMDTGMPDGVMISLADKPLVTTDVIDRVIERFKDSECDICLPVFRGERGHPVILRGTLHEDVMNLEGDRGARAVVDGHTGCVEEVAVDSDCILVDVDTPGDLEKVRRRLDRIG